MRLLALVLAFVAFQVYWFKHETATEERLGQIASGIARKDVSVRCPSVWRRALDISMHRGVAHVPPDGSPGYARLAHDICQTFEEIVDQGFRKGSYECLITDDPLCDDWVYEAALAVDVLAHEAWHLAGVRNESEAECFAMQSGASVAEQLGATREQAVAIAVYAYRANGAAPDRYQITTECAPGQRLDLHPETSAWPVS